MLKAIFQAIILLVTVANSQASQVLLAPLGQQVLQAQQESQGPLALQVQQVLQVQLVQV